MSKLESGNAVIHESNLAKLRDMLYKKPRDLLLFELGIGSGLKIKEILQLRVIDLADKNVDDKISFICNGKEYCFILNSQIKSAFNSFIRTRNVSYEEYIFKAKSGNVPLAMSTISNIVKNWFIDIKIEGTYGSRCLYETWKYYDNKSRQEDSHARHEKDMTFKKLPQVEKQSIQKQILSILYDKIIWGEIPPGTELNATKLSKQFNVSLTPVRMALTSLEAQGLVIAPKKKACIVRELSIERALEIFLIRSVIEPFAVEQSMKYYRKETLEELEYILKMCERSDDWNSFMRLHKEFHMTLIQDSRMPYLLEIIGDLHDRSNALILMYNEILDVKEARKIRVDNLSRHYDILNSIKDKNLDMTKEYIKIDAMEGMSRLNIAGATKSDLLRTSKNQ